MTPNDPWDTLDTLVISTGEAADSTGIPYATIISACLYGHIDARKYGRNNMWMERQSWETWRARYQAKKAKQEVTP